MMTPLQPGETRSTCCYCGVGCGVIIETRETGHPASGAREIVGVRGDPDHPANFGRLCSKGATLHLSAAGHRYAQTRAAHPEIRVDRTEARQRVGWDEALAHVTDRFAAIMREHGPDSVGLYISGQLLTEDYYVFNKLAKGLLGTNNIDSNSRLCMSSAVSGYKLTLGADAPPCSYDDLNHANTVFIAGANPAFAHPVLYRRLEDARAANPALRVVVVDPRRTDSASEATLHLPIIPGTDVALFHAMLHVMLWEGLVDRAFIEAHTSGFEALRDTVRDATPGSASRVCGIPAEDIVTAARWFAEGPTLSLYCQGLNQSSSGSAKNAALINLHLATAQIGKVGAGPFSLTGQPNAMGGREVGGMATLLSGHRDINHAPDRDEIARLWGVEALPAKPGKTAVEMFDALADGSLKAIWIVCTNPAQSMPNQSLVRKALARAEFVVLQEAYANTATAPFADVLLPATTWGEKEGTVTNSERRISRVRAARAAYAEARDDWQIAADVARRLEARLRPGLPSIFSYQTAESVWNEHRTTTVGRDLDIGGLSYALLETQGPQQWPYPAGATGAAERLYLDHRFATPDGRARFANVRYTSVAEAVDARHPFALTTGRLRDQWHGMSRTGTVEKLFSHMPEPGVELNARDIERLGLVEGSLAHLTSRRGSIVMPVRASETVQPGQAFVAMHWGEEYLSGSAGGQPAHGVNSLTTGAFDPLSKQPELKHAAIRIMKAELSWQWTVFACLPADEALEVQLALRPYLTRFPFASCVPFAAADGRVGVSWRAADYQAVDLELQQEVEAHFGIVSGAPNMLDYKDGRRGTARRLVVENGVLKAVSLAGDISAAGWLRDYLDAATSVASLGRRLLLPSSSAPPSSVAPRGKTVCNCIGVGERQIVDLLALQPASADRGKRLDALKRQLRCGTQCGSCVPELKRLIEATPLHNPA
jgi:assimilatory nitrate reductase catalytic subunit